MTGLSLNPAQDHFILRTDKASISLTPEELLTLAEMAPSLRQQALTMIYPSRNKSSAEAVTAMDVFDFRLHREAMETKLLLTLRLGTAGNSNVAYAFSRSLADRLARKIPALLPAMRDSPPMKQ